MDTQNDGLEKVVNFNMAVLGIQVSFWGCISFRFEQAPGKLI